MAQWTAEEKQYPPGFWDEVDTIRGEAFGIQIVISPWTESFLRYFRNVSSYAAISRNATVKAHDKKVLSSFGDAVNNLENIKETFTKLSELHWNKLQVDPENLRLLGNIVIIILANH